jgi:hypothetical protein
MTTLPYVFSATPEDPAICRRGRHVQDHGLCVETEDGDIFCESHVWDMGTAFTAYSMERDGHAPPPEEVRP